MGVVMGQRGTSGCGDGQTAFAFIFCWAVSLLLCTVLTCINNTSHNCAYHEL